MTPIWIRKHRDMLPSVFVLTLSLWEPDQLEASTSSPDFERFDHELVHEIVERKKTTSERGIKLAVVILTSRLMLDHPELDSRLSFIRKRSSLDARASLFVLSPVPPADVANFLKTLKAELHEPAMDYYREHSRRLRRKRSRSTSHSFAQSSSYHQPGQLPTTTPLNPQGWAVRSDYKLATFAEFRQEFQVALKSYEDCWEGLCQMFLSTAILPPRTKRWAEAKVFIDCISFKISKLYLIASEPTRAMYQYHKHINKFHELCNGWGIGDETYEFWAWLSKQYNVLADLVDIGCRSGMRLPNLCPPPTPMTDKNRSASPILTDSRLTGGGAVNLVGVLVHPGFYYFHAAQCAVERRDKFRAYEAVQEEMGTMAESKRDSVRSQASLALAHEKKVNHPEIIVGLYTKAYEIFKTVGSHRMTLFVALKIALVHHNQNDYNTSYKFFERILTSYRKSHFDHILDTLLYLSFQSLKGMVNQWKTRTSSTAEPGPPPVEVIQLLKISLELLGSQLLASSADPELSTRHQDLCKTWSGLIQPFPSENRLSEVEPLRLELEPSAFPVRVQIAFWENSILLGDEMDFQILLTIPQGFADCHPIISSIDLKLTSMPVLTIRHRSTSSPEASQPCNHQTLDLGVVSSDDDPQGTVDRTFPLDLRAIGKSFWLITGRLRPSVIDKVILEKIIFHFDHIINGISVEFMLSPGHSPNDPTLNPLRWITGFEPDRHETIFLPTEDLQSSCQAQAKDPQITFSIAHEPYGMIYEEQTFRLLISNQEETDALDLKLGVKLQSPSATDSIQLDDQIHTHPHDFIIKLGVLKAQETLEKCINLRAVEKVGMRILEVDLIARVDHHRTKPEGSDEDLESFKFHRKLSVEMEQPIQVDFKIHSIHQLNHALNHPGPWSLSSPSSHLQLTRPPSIQNRMNLNFLISNSSSSQYDSFMSILNSIKIQKVLLSLEKASCSINTLSCSLQQPDSSDLNIDLGMGESYLVSYLVELEMDLIQEVVTDCSFEVTWTCSHTGTETAHTNRIPLKIEIPIPRPIAVLTNLKPHLKLLEPVTVKYIIENRNLVKTVEVMIKVSERTVKKKSQDIQGTGSSRVDGRHDWILTGPTLINSMIILPRSCKVLTYTCIPIRLGVIDPPLIEVFERINHRQVSRTVHSSNPTTDRNLIECSISSLNDLQSLDLSFNDRDDRDDDDDDTLSIEASQPMDQNVQDQARRSSYPKLVPIRIYRFHSLVDPAHDPHTGDPRHGTPQDGKLSDRSDHPPRRPRPTIGSDPNLKVLIVPA